MPKFSTLYRLTGHLQAPADIWCSTSRFTSFTAEADSRLGLIPAIIAHALKGLGWKDDQMLAGLLIDFINHFPDEVRTAIAEGIIGGLAMLVRKDGDCLMVDMAQVYNALGPAGKEKRRPSGLIIPGK